MKKRLIEQSPIVVFGTGGSGTRVVTQILKESGCYVGDNLNGPFDNLTFGYFLAGRTQWMQAHFPFENENDLKSANYFLNIFKKVYFGHRLKTLELKDAIRIFFEFAGKDRAMLKRRPFKERFVSGSKLFKKMFFSGNNRSFECKKWGFKSPEAIYFINPLIAMFPEIKFIHLIRDGRDMAVSTNVNPLRYRKLFNVRSENHIQAALDNWLRVNKWAKDVCRSKLSSSQYLLIKYEDICKHPVSSVNKILEFTGLNPNNIKKVYGIPKDNSNIGRWKNCKQKFIGINRQIFLEFGYAQV